MKVEGEKGVREQHRDDQRRGKREILVKGEKEALPPDMGTEMSL